MWKQNNDIGWNSLSCSVTHRCYTVTVLVCPFTLVCERVTLSRKCPWLRSQAESHQASLACYCVGDTLSWGKQIRLAARPDPWAIGPLKWVSTEPWLICAPCGTRVHACLYNFAVMSRARQTWAGLACLGMGSRSGVSRLHMSVPTFRVTFVEVSNLILLPHSLLIFICRSCVIWFYLEFRYITLPPHFHPLYLHIGICSPS